MQTEIQISPVGCALTIAFYNKSHTPPTLYVWVCRNRDSYDLALKELAETPYCEIVHQGNSVVK